MSGLTDPLGDMLTRIRNGLHARLETIEVPASKLRAQILELLVREGYISGYNEKEVRRGVNVLHVNLKYFNGEPSIKNIHRISRPGRRVYSSFSEMKMVSNGLGIAVVSTTKGLMTDHQARSGNIGGEILFTVF
ncbi:MAG: 30S ribosomal protein S8 [Alphaproteobacteria bacterium]|nr:30S ribosomal protein S8 [Alphaproteobacteria bacterium]